MNFLEQHRGFKILFLARSVFIETVTNEFIFPDLDKDCFSERRILWNRQWSLYEKSSKFRAILKSYFSMSKIPRFK